LNNFRLNLAKLFCIIAHGRQKRKYTGQPYWTHPFAVSGLVREYGKDLNTQIAALLHDTVEDTWVRPWVIGLLFGPIVQQLVAQVTDVSVKSDGNRAVRKAIDLKHLMEASREGQTIKIADLLHNAESIIKHDPNFAKVFVVEAKKINNALYKADYFLSARLGMLLRGSND
jgi:(p)ppGpp synthase/HD superfamily hydrolase